ncbi:MAG: Rieske 2Fe-2S domain-containing protein [Hyphomonadaceae bacterium]
MSHYPFRTDTYFPRNVWYIAAKTEEVGQDLWGRTFFDERVLLYRTKSGAVTALSGLCPHRFLPLEKGVRIGDNVQCGYHGIVFDETGACLRIPSQEEIPERCRLTKFPTLERGGFVWIWMGDPDKADAALMPDLQAAGLEGPDWVACPNPVFHFNGRPQLAIDNLFDLTHVPFAHSTGAQFRRRRRCVIRRARSRHGWPAEGGHAQGTLGGVARSQGRRAAADPALSLPRHQRDAVELQCRHRDAEPGPHQRRLYGSVAGARRGADAA